MMETFYMKKKIAMQVLQKTIKTVPFSSVILVHLYTF